MSRNLTKELTSSLATTIPSIARVPLSEQTRKEIWGHLANWVESGQGNPKVMLPDFATILAATLDTYERGDLFHTLEYVDEETGEIKQHTLWRLPAAVRDDGAQVWVDPLAEDPDQVFLRASIYDNDMGELGSLLKAKEKINGKERTVYLWALPRETKGENAKRPNKQNSNFPAFPGLSSRGQLGTLGIGSYETCERVPRTRNSVYGYIPFAVAKVIAGILKPDVYGWMSHYSEKILVMRLLGLLGLVNVYDDKGNVKINRVRPLEMTNVAYVELICNIGTLLKYIECDMINSDPATRHGYDKKLGAIIDSIKQQTANDFWWSDLERCAKEIKYGLPGVMGCKVGGADLFIVNHKDNNPRNNCAYNLEVATQKSNEFHEAVVARALLSRYRDTICERDQVSGKIVLSRDYRISIYQIDDFIDDYVFQTGGKAEASDVATALRNDCEMIGSVSRGYNATSFFNEYSSPSGVCYEEISLATVKALKKLKDLSVDDLIKLVDYDDSMATPYNKFVNSLVETLPQTDEDRKILIEGLYDGVTGEPFKIVTSNKICNSKLDNSKIYRQSVFSLFMSWLLAHGWGKGALGSTYGSAFNASPDVTCMVNSYEDDDDEGGAAL